MLLPPISQPHKTHCLIVLACHRPLRIASQPPTVLLRGCSTCCVIKGVFTLHTSLMECQRSSTRHETIQEAPQHHVLPIHVTAFREHNSNAALHFPSYHGCLLLNTTFTSLVIHCKQAPAGLVQPQGYLYPSSRAPKGILLSSTTPAKLAIFNQHYHYIYHSACIAQYVQSIVNTIHQAPPHLYHHPASSINSHSNSQPADRPLSASICHHLPSSRTPISEDSSHLLLQAYGSDMKHQHTPSA